MELTRTEAQVMKHLWKLKKAYMKDILDEYPEPKPKSTTLATLLKRMTDKGFVGFDQRGNNREYYPLVRKEKYFSKHLSNMVKDFFNDSDSQFASFFTRESDMSVKELEDLKAEIEARINKKK
jgi:BlaI family penicillinase repressor